MEAQGQKFTNSKNSLHPSSNVEKAASEFLNDGKKLAGAIYEDGVQKVNQAEENLKEYSDEMLRKIQKNPLASVLIAGGVGFLLSLLLKK